VLDQCPPPGPDRIGNAREPRYAGAAINSSIERFVRVVTEDELRTRSGTFGIDIDAAGDETQAMFTLEFAPGSFAVNGKSFPDTNDDITLAADAPAGTTLALNASEARSGRITVLLNSTDAIRSGF